MSTYQALYYPFIHFKNDGWVKVAALYWDKLGRIVPYEYVTEDSDTVKALGSFVTTLRPGWVLPEFAQSWVEFVTQHGPKLKAKYALSHRDQWPVLPETERPPRPGGPSGNDPRLGYVFVEKMSEDVYRAMKQSDLCSTDTPRGQWIGMHPRLAWVYMTALAEQLAGERGLRPLTDETRDHLAVSGLSTERLAHALLGSVALVDSKPTPTEIETTLISIAFRSVVPADPAALAVDKVLAFREKYPNERAAFQDAVTSFLGSREWLKSIADPHVLEQRLRDEYEKSWATKLEDLRDKLAEVGIDTVLSCFNLKAVLPAGVVAVAGALAVPLNPIAAGVAGLALGAIPALRDKRKTARQELKASPVSFLYRMEQDLAPKDVWSWIKQKSVQFALGV
ncbi:MAG TPA: DUF6236 family protein [Anaeromyxobacter sp.]|nr:DUF6236 family protein [Anaeromyxobacter sp.]